MVKLRIKNLILAEGDEREFYLSMLKPFDEDKWQNNKLYEFDSLLEAGKFIESAKNEIVFNEANKINFIFGDFDENKCTNNKLHEFDSLSEAVKFIESSENAIGFDDPNKKTNQCVVFWKIDTVLFIDGDELVYVISIKES